MTLKYLVIYFALVPYDYLGVPLEVQFDCNKLHMENLLRLKREFEESFGNHIECFFVVYDRQSNADILDSRTL
jgi:hypothetical protein